MLDQIVSNYTGKRASTIKKICSPLHDYLGIDVFLYFSIDAEGNFVTLSNYAEQLDFYYNEKFYLTNPYLIHPHLLRSGCVLTSTTNDPEYLETIDRSRKNYMMQNPFLMLERRGNVLEGFLFSKNANDFDPSIVYFNQLDLLKKFSKYFLRETKTLIGQMKADKYNMHCAKGDAFLERETSLPLSSLDTNVQQLLKIISPLTRREQECLDLYCRGFSAQATAAQLNISQRTVESYFDNIKNKLHCTNKSELLDQ